MKILKSAFFLCILFSAFNLTKAQKLITHFQHLNLKEGLSQASVNAILQDKEGFIWIATQDGLNKFDGYKFTVYRYNESDKNSLSYNYIYSLIEDSDGYLWIGTDKGGLNRFDKKSEKFTHFIHKKNNPNSIISNVARSICQDSLGNLWIGSFEGLSKLPSKYRSVSKDSITSVKFDRYTAESSELSTNTITSLTCDKNGNVWIGTINGLNFINSTQTETPEFKVFSHSAKDPSSLSSSFIYRNSIFCDGKNNLWVGTKKGLNRFISIKKGFERILSDEINLSNYSIQAVLRDRNNNLWLGTKNGLIKYSIPDNTFRLIQNDLNDPKSLSFNNITSIIEDRGGNIWIGTYGGGVNKINYGSDKFEHYKITDSKNVLLHNQNIWSIFIDSENRLWIGTDNNGLQIFKDNNRIAIFDNKLNSKKLSDLKITSILQDFKNDFWIGSNNGLNKIKINAQNKIEFVKIFTANSTGLSTLRSNLIRNVFEDSQNNLWISTWGGGVTKIFNSGKNNTLTTIFKTGIQKKYLSNNSIRPIIELSDGSLWIGSYRGINVLKDLENPTPGNFINIFRDPQNKHSLTNDGTSSILEDSEGNIWLGTRNGINILTNHERNNLKSDSLKFKHLRERDGLLNEVIYGMLQDKNKNIWCSTNRGLSKINSKNFQITNYQEVDGLQSDEFNVASYFKSDDGKLFFGGINGITAFYPDSIKTYRYSPKVVFTDFLLFNKSVQVSDSSLLSKNINYTKSITLKYDQNLFAFEFSSLNYRQPSNIKYKYKLEGLHEDWIETDHLNRRATFTNLSQGKYTLKVKACNDDGIWCEEETEIQITILPPFWLTIWAKGFYISVIVFIGIVIHLQQKNKVKQKQRELELEKELSLQLENHNKTLEDKVLERTKELKSAKQNAEEANKLKTELLSIAAHDLKNPLNIILGFSSLIKNDLSVNSENFKHLESIRKSSDDMLEIISKLLDSSAIETGELKLEKEITSLNNIFNSVLNEYTLLADNKNQKIIFTPPVKNIFIDADTGRIKEVISNVISNAVKYSPFNSEIKINFEIIKSEIFINITDQGPGISENDLSKLFMKFQKLSSIPTGGESSTGLGLSIAKQLSQLHKGDIKVKSKPGYGSTFTIVLPFVRLEELSKDIDSIEEKRYHFDGQKIFIADDIRENRKLIIQMLGDLNLTFVEAGNGMELIELTNKIVPDFIFCDINMPELNGLEALQILRKNHKTKNTPVVALTTSRDNKIINAGFNSVIYKPFNKNSLLRELAAEFYSEDTSRFNQDVCSTEEISHFIEELGKIRESELLILKQKFITASSTMIIDDVLNFATMTNFISEKNNLEKLNTFSEKLIEHCNDINVNSINNSLVIFSEIINN